MFEAPGSFVTQLQLTNTASLSSFLGDRPGFPLQLWDTVAWLFLSTQARCFSPLCLCCPGPVLGVSLHTCSFCTKAGLHLTQEVLPASQLAAHLPHPTSPPYHPSPLLASAANVITCISLLPVCPGLLWQTRLSFTSVFPELDPGPGNQLATSIR